MSALDAAVKGIAKLQEAADVYTSSLQSSTKVTVREPAPSKQELQTLAEGLKLEASKIGLMWGSNTPSQAEAESLVAALEQRHSQLLALLCRAGFSAGPMLLQSLQSAASPVTAACIHLLKFVSSETLRQNSEAAVQTGKVWAACDAVSTMALDNKTAIGRKLLHISRSVKDNIREVQEVIADSRSQVTNHEQSNDKHQDSDVDLDFEAEALGPVEIETAETALGMIQLVLDIVKLLVRMILTENDVSTATGLDDWESLLFHVKGMADVSNDLAAALFAPQDIDEIISATDSLQNGCELVLDEIPDGLRPAHTEVIETLAQHVSDAHKSIASILAVDVSGLTI